MSAISIAIVLLLGVCFAINSSTSVEETTTTNEFPDTICPPYHHRSDCSPDSGNNTECITTCEQAHIYTNCACARQLLRSRDGSCVAYRQCPAINFTDLILYHKIVYLDDNKKAE